MSLLKTNEIQVFNGTTVTITAPAVITANDNTNAALRITQTGTGNALVVEDDSGNPDSTPFVVDASGNVGIGTTPSQKLEVLVNETTGSKIYTKLDGTSNKFTNLVIDCSEDFDDSRAVLYFYHDSTPSAYVGTNYRTSDGAADYLQLRTLEADQDIVLTATGEITASTAGTERMRIDTSGNVGIGTSSPSAKLDVKGALYSGNSGTTSQEQIQFNCQSTYAGQIYTNNLENLWLLSGNKYNGSNYVVNTGTAAANIKLIAGTIRFETDNGLTASSSFTPTERMRIDTSGNVGIGTSSPSQKLDVTGNINATGALTLGTALAITEGGTGVTSLGSLDAAGLGSGSATDGYVLTADGAGGAAWEAASGGGGGTTAYVEHSSTISDSFTVTSGNNRMYIGGTTFSGTITVAGRLAIVAGPANFTGTINITGTLAIMG